MVARFRSWWQQIKPHPVATVLIALLAVVIVLIILIILGYIFNWGWTGLGPYISPPHPKDSDFQRGKTLWDWLQLLIIPAVLAVAGYVINLTISRGEQEATKQRAQSEREAAEKRAETEHEIALDNQREAALKEYIDRMSELLLHEYLLGADPRKEALEMARVQTITILRRLDADRKGFVIQFLHDAGLIIRKSKDGSLEVNSIISLYKADLRGANLSKAFLLVGDLSNTDLCGANMSHAILHGANLGKANLSEADLSEATLWSADLHGANLSGANLQRADLSDAYLVEAIVTPDQLNTAKSLKGATLP